METESAVMDVEQVDGGQDQQIDEGQQHQQDENQDQQQQRDTDPYSPKASKQYSDWLKGLRADPANKDFVRRSQDNHSRLYALHQLEPKGIDGVREKYALLDSVMHGDLKGTEAIGAMQDQIREYGEVDEALAAGDPRALESLGDEFNDGLAKLTPHILDRIQQSDPEAYAAAILPHFVQALAQSDLVHNFNGLVDALNEQMPSWLPEDKKAAWTADKMQRVLGLVGGMGQWLNTQAENAKKLGPNDGKQTSGGKRQVDQAAQDRTKFQNDVRDHHWKTEIIPQRDRLIDSGFNSAFRPYAKRLNLDKIALDGLKREFGTRVIANATANKDYKGSITRLYSQPKADPKMVINLARAEFGKHYEAVMKALINERYRPFLNGKTQNSGQQNQNGNRNSGAANTAAGPKEFVSTARPRDEDIDFKHPRFVELRHQNKYPLKNGRVQVVRK